LEREAVDPVGRELTRGDFFGTDRLAIVASFPVLALPTLYSRIGDVFAYVSIIVMIALSVAGVCASIAPPACRRHRRASPRMSASSSAA
jgi:apolipoprotein N-acyltransferase